MSIKFEGLESVRLGEREHEFALVGGGGKEIAGGGYGRVKVKTDLGGYFKVSFPVAEKDWEAVHSLCVVDGSTGELAEFLNCWPMKVLAGQQAEFVLGEKE